MSEITDNAHKLLKHALGLISSRISLAMIELSEARDSLVAVIILAACVAFFVAISILLISAYLVILGWDTLGAWTVLLEAMTYALIAWVLWRKAKNIITTGGLKMPLTTVGLQQDRDTLFPKDRQ
ncbi:MAG: hypothetical protein RL707_206 [Pseudomonadota bacterium]